MKSTLFFSILVIALASSSTARGQSVIYVDDDAAAGGDGSSWNLAYRFLSDAIDHAALTPSADEIRIGEGVYKPDQSAAFPAGTGDQCVSFAIPDSLTVGVTKLIGGYQGLGTPGDPEERDPNTFPTVLTGDLAGNDPAWPFLGDEPEWDENSSLIITANAGVIYIDGLRVRGALQTLLNTGYNLESNNDPTWATNITIKNCVFSDSPLRDISQNMPCPDYHRQGGKALSISDGQYWENNSVDNTLENVLIEHIASDARSPIVEFGAGISSWSGGGIRECVIKSGVNIDAEYQTRAYVSLTNLAFEDIQLIDIASPGEDHYIIKLHDNTESHISNCTFRRIEIDDSFSWMEYGPAIIALEYHERYANPAIPKIVQDCVFEDIGDPDNPESHSGSTIHAATLVENCQFRRIVRPYGFLVYAIEVRSSQFEDCDIQNTWGSSHPDYRYDQFFEIDGRPGNSFGIVLARDVHDLTFNNIVCGGSILEIVATGNSCNISNCIIVSAGSADTAPVMAHYNAVLSQFEIVDNILGDGTFSSSSSASCGLLLNSLASIHHSTIARNRVNTSSGYSTAAGGIEAYGGSGIYNCVIIDNGLPINPADSAAHAAVNTHSSGENPIHIVQSTITGNTSNDIGGVEIWRYSSEVAVILINTVVANNTSTQILNPDCWDLSSDNSCNPRGYEIINSLITRDLPRFMNPATGDYRPANGSPAIDAGDNSFVTPDTYDLDNDGNTTEPIPFDANGNPRIADDPGTPGASVDIGAYEFQGTTCLADVNNDGVLTAADFTAWIFAFNTLSPEADQNRDGAITPADFTAWIANFNAGC